MALNSKNIITMYCWLWLRINFRQLSKDQIDDIIMQAESLKKRRKISLFKAVKAIIKTFKKYKL